MCHANFGVGVSIPILGKQRVGKPVMVQLDKALVGSYKLSIVTMPLTEAV